TSTRAASHRSSGTDRSPRDGKAYISDRCTLPLKPLEQSCGATGADSGADFGCGAHSDATLFRRTTTVMGDRRHVFNVGDLQAAAVQGTNRGLAPRARTHDAHLDVLYTVFLGRVARALGGHLRG